MTELPADVGPEEVESWFVEEDEASDELDAQGSAAPTDPAQKYAVSQLRVVRETKDYQLDYLQHALQPAFVNRNGALFLADNARPHG